MSVRRRLLASWLVVLGLFVVGIGEAKARCTFGVCEVSGDGPVVRASEERVASIQASKPAGSAGERFEFRFEVHCDGADAGASCRGAMLACIGDGPGPLHDIFRRTVDARGVPSPWARVGDTCFPPATAGPQLTYAMIRDAFHLTPWAKAVITTQPKGDVTLVGLKTYFKVNWSTDGYEPGEIDSIDPARMLGHRVDIRPKIVGVTYRFGDGTGFGPTPDLGGVYPTGGIVHTYSTKGVYATHVEVVWTADFRVDGGPWTAIPETVTITGPDTPVTVKIAKAVLVS